MRILVPTAIFGLLVIRMLKYTNNGQQNNQARRMRTALDQNDASPMASIENQMKLKAYLTSRTISGGIGSARPWVQRFSLGTFFGKSALLLLTYKNIC